MLSIWPSFFELKVNYDHQPTTSTSLNSPFQFSPKILQNSLIVILKNFLNLKATQLQVDYNILFRQSKVVLLSKLENLGEKDQDLSLDWL